MYIKMALHIHILVMRCVSNLKKKKINSLYQRWILISLVEFDFVIVD